MPIMPTTMIPHQPPVIPEKFPFTFEFKESIYLHR